jgi:hypothetical protein
MRAAIAFVLSSLVACSARDDVPAPVVSSVVPNHAPANAVVMVSGSYFCQRPNVNPEDPTCPVTGTVLFGAVPGVPSTYSDVSIMVEVPAGASGATTISITAGGRTSNSIAFTVD